jgi:dTDP-4-amino-4,6-dideoxygalactose transaminase
MIPVQRPCLGQEELRLVGEVFDSRWLGMGSFTRTFEDRLRALLGVRHVVAVNTGTSALHLALNALGLESGDEVIVPSLTFVATAQAILQAGARPVFCEVCPNTLNIDLDDAFSRVTARTRVILPVHYGGLSCDMDALLPFARERGIRIV